jgi:hypothetical protein
MLYGNLGEKSFDTSMSLIFNILLDTRYMYVELKIRPDFRYPAFTGYPVSGFWIGRISGASLMFTCAIMYRYLQVVQQIRAAEDKDDISSQGDEQIFTPQVSKLRSLNF